METPFISPFKYLIALLDSNPSNTFKSPVKDNNLKTKTGSGPMPEKDGTSDEEQPKNISPSTKLYDDLPEPKHSEPREEDLSDESTTKGKKKKKKDKKEKKKKRKKEKEKDREKDDSRRRKRELATQITLAKKIADKEKREIRRYANLTYQCIDCMVHGYNNS